MAIVIVCKWDGTSSFGPSSKYTIVCDWSAAGLVVTAPTMLPRGIDAGGTGRAAADEASAAEEVALAAGPADATGVHGGGGHAVMDAAVGGAGSPLGCAEAAATSEAVPGGFSGAITGGSPSQPRETIGPKDTNASSVNKRFMATSIQ
ncbi:MAG: hypothetical protein WBY94_03415 [Polyangiaceae bacterium]